MRDIGIDFGTTNSTIAYFENGETRIFAPQANNNIPQIRSAVAEDKDGRTFIGRAAFLCGGIRGVSLVDRFKLLIGADRETVAARTFLRELINLYQRESGVDGIENLVITVPDTWMRESGQRQYRALQDICAQLQLPVRKILSEPVAAASHYVHLLSERRERFDGHLLVYDHGGGTLDLALLQVEGETLRTLDGGGLSGLPSGDGVGGTHFDAAVARLLSTKNSSWRQIIEANRIEWLDAFEQRKIELAGLVKDRIRGYEGDNRSEDFDVTIFEVKEVPVQPSTLVEAFERSIAGAAKRAVDNLISAHSSYIDFNNTSRFRILSVGGFSNFCLVQELLRQTFKHKGDDKRFDARFTSSDRAFAVAKGACLYAARRTEIHETCPVGVAIILHDSHRRNVRLKLLRRAEWLDTLRQPRFQDEIIEATSDKADVRNKLLTFEIDGTGGTVAHRPDVPVEKAVPDFARATRWRVGAYVTKDMIVHVVFETADQRKSRQELTLGDLINLSNQKEQGYSS